MTKKIFFSFLATIAVSAVSLANPIGGSTKMMISINKATEGSSCSEISQERLQELINVLNYQDASFGLEKVTASVTDYTDYCSFKPDADFYGVAHVLVEYTSDTKLQFYTDRIEQLGDAYTSYSNVISPAASNTGSRGQAGSLNCQLMVNGTVRVLDPAGATSTVEKDNIKLAAKVKTVTSANGEAFSLEITDYSTSRIISSQVYSMNFDANTQPSISYSSIDGSTYAAITCTK